MISGNLDLPAIPIHEASEFGPCKINSYAHCYNNGTGWRTVYPNPTDSFHCNVLHSSYTTVGMHLQCRHELLLERDTTPGAWWLEADAPIGKLIRGRHHYLAAMNPSAGSCARLWTCWVTNVGELLTEGHEAPPTFLLKVNPPVQYLISQPSWWREWLWASTKSWFEGMGGGAEGMRSNATIPSQDMTAQGSATSGDSLQHITWGICELWCWVQDKGYMLIDSRLLSSLKKGIEVPGVHILWTTISFLPLFEATSARNAGSTSSWPPPQASWGTTKIFLPVRTSFIMICREGSKGCWSIEFK